MKITIEKDQLQDGLQAVQAVIPSRPDSPIVSTVLVRASDAGIELTGTDMDMSITTTLQADVSIEGETAIPATKFFSIVRAFSLQEVKITTDTANEVSELRCGSAKFRIHGLPAAEFPILARVAGGKSITIPQLHLKRLIQKTAFAMSTDGTRPQMNGVFLEIGNGCVTMSGCDGRRVASSYFACNIPESAAGSCIIPSKAVTHIKRLVQDGGDATIEVSENSISITFTGIEGTNKTRIISKLVEGNYPPFRQVIPDPETTTHRVQFSREELMSAIGRVALMVSEQSLSVKFSFHENAVDISSNTAGVGDASETIAIKYKGAPMEVALNPHYCMDVLKALEEEDIYLLLVDVHTPVVFRVNSPFVAAIAIMRTQ